MSFTLCEGFFLLCVCVVCVVCYAILRVYADNSLLEGACDQAA